MAGLDGEVDLQDLLLEAQQQLGLPTSSPPPGGAPPPPESEGVVVFSRGGTTYRVSLADIYTRFTVGSLYLVQTFDPRSNPDIRIFGLPEPIAQWILYIAANQMRPGEYRYFLKIEADVTTLVDYIGDPSNPSSMVGAPGAPRATNSSTVYTSKTMPTGPYTLLSVHLDNRTEVNATLQLYGSYASNPGTPPAGWAPIGPAVTVNAGTDGVSSVDLTANLYPFVVAVVTYASAPQTGFLRVVPLGKRT